MKFLSILVLVVSCFAVYSKSVSKEESQSNEIVEIKEALEAAKVAVIRAQQSLEKATQEGRSLAGASMEAQGHGKCQYCQDKNAPLHMSNSERDASTAYPNVPESSAQPGVRSGSSKGIRK